MTPEIVAYTAGLFDGEGCVSLGLKSRSYAIQIVMVNTHKPVLDWVQEHWDGRVYQLRTGVRGSSKGRPPHWSVCWEWYLHRPDMSAFLAAIEPYLIVKKRAALIGLEFLKTPAIGNRRAELFAELRGLPRPSYEPASSAQLSFRSEYFGE